MPYKLYWKHLAISFLTVGFLYPPDYKVEGSMGQKKAMCNVVYRSKKLILSSIDFSWQRSKAAFSLIKVGPYTMT